MASEHPGHTGNLESLVKVTTVAVIWSSQRVRWDLRLAWNKVHKTMILMPKPKLISVILITAHSNYGLNPTDSIYKVQHSRVSPSKPGQYSVFGLSVCPPWGLRKADLQIPLLL